MIKKDNIKYLVLLVVLFLTSIVVVKADDTCDTVTKGKLRQAAANIKANYIVKEEEFSDTDDDGNEFTYTEKHLEIKIYNVVSGMYLTVKSSLAEDTDEKIETVSKSLYRTDVGADGAITIKQDNFPYMINYEIKVYASVDSPCNGTSLRTINITLPKYNEYSAYTMCEGLSDYYLCQEYITFDIDGSTLLKKINDYKEKLTEEVENMTIEDSNTTSDLISGISSNKYLIVGIIISIAVVITIIILRKKKV